MLRTRRRTDLLQGCRRAIDYFVVPLIATILLGILLIFPGILAWFNQQIPQRWLCLWIILLVFFTLVYITERLVVLL